MKRPHLGKTAISIALVFAGLGLFCVVFAVVGLQQVLRGIERAGFVGFAALLAMNILAITALSLGWKIILKTAGHRVSLIHLATGTIMGFTFSFLTPSAYLGGEPVKTFFIAEMKAARKREILATIIVSKFLEFVGLVAVMYFSTTVVLLKFEITRFLGAVLLGADAVLGLFLFFLLRSFLKNRRLTVRLIDLLIRIGIARKFLANIRHKAEDMEDLIHGTFRGSWKTLLLALPLHVLSVVISFLKPFIFFLLLPVPHLLTVTQISVVFMLSQLILIFQFIPGSLGMYEGGQAGIFSLIEMAASDGLVFAAFMRMCDIVLVGMGGVLSFRFGLNHIASLKKELQQETTQIENRKSKND